jgi:hypothetical protein
MMGGKGGKEKGGVSTNKYRQCHSVYSMPDVAAAYDVNLLS